MSSTSQTEKTILVILALAALLVIPVFTMGGGMMSTGWDIFGGGMFVWPLLVLGLIALALYWARSQPEDSNAEQPDPARAELRERYARGEIDDEEFENRLQMLSDNR
ncbi:SHOCT domain-containing protein [Natronolimnohabitans sp. A-GB9]|uniref:SHOCT domain-containing protein n=1 Tax=Natronolimnohabitans sp. A-GB9 TaxID=3069757 RepID=UPI0027B71155|nr:SHOCT domain-containing protein [Natronolimnohabitans sp. A-GB9]MDQ2051712.1 SHOCT domain-containing protein [Natronolimnohabitans sp. A-GB9]